VDYLILLVGSVLEELSLSGRVARRLLIADGRIDIGGMDTLVGRLGRRGGDPTVQASMDPNSASAIRHQRILLA